MGEESIAKKIRGQGIEEDGRKRRAGEKEGLV